MAPKEEKRKSERRGSEEVEEEEPPPPPPPPPPSLPPPPGFYSVWAEPADYDPSLHLIMTQLKEQHEGPMFSPHVTILGAHYSEWPDAETILRHSVNPLCLSPSKLRRLQVGDLIISASTYLSRKPMRWLVHMYKLWDVSIS